MSYDTSYSITYVSGTRYAPQCSHPTSPSDVFCAQCGLRLSTRNVVDIIEELLIDKLKYNPFQDTHSWYAHINDLCKITKQFPETAIALYGRGEDDDDLWVKYFLNGKFQTEEAKIIYAEFNKSKLKSPTCGK